MYLLLRAVVIAFLGFLLQSWLSKILTTPQRFCFVPMYSVPLDCLSLMSFITSLSPPPLCRFPIVRTLVTSCTWNCLLRHLRLQANWKEVVSVGVSPSLSQPVLAFLWQFGRWTNFPVFGSTPGLLMHPSHPSTPHPPHTRGESGLIKSPPKFLPFVTHFCLALLLLFGGNFGFTWERIIF